jgi:PTS system cellobiose-specific IIB component
MRVLIICAGGLTSNILKNRLYQLAGEQNRQDEFTACGVSNLDLYIHSCDLLCITPQVSYRQKQLHDLAAKERIPLVSLSEEEFSFQNVEQIYKILDTAYQRFIEQETNSKGHGQEDQYDLRTSVAMALWEGTLICIFGGILGILRGSQMVENQQFLSEILQLFIVLTIGFQYAKKHHLNEISCSLIALMIPFFLFSKIGITPGQRIMPWGIQFGIECFTVWIACFLYEKISRICETIHLFRSDDIIHNFSDCVPITVIIIIIMMQRFLLNAFLPL